LTDRKTIKVKRKDNKIIIKFPAGIPAILSPVVFFFFIVFAEWRPHTEDASAWAVIFSYTCLVFFVLSYIMLFMRKIIIDKDKKTITYFSYFYQTYNFSDVIYMRSEFDRIDNSEYFLLIELRQKAIRVKTRSYEQSEMLRMEILSIINL